MIVPFNFLQTKSPCKGFSLIEMLFGLMILAILVRIGFSSYDAMVGGRTLSAAAEGLMQDIQFAQQSALQKQQDMYLSFSVGAAWCYGLDDTASCNCATANSCAINGTQKVVSSTNFSNLTLSTTGLAGTTITFDNNRGIVSTTGSFIFTRGTQNITVQINDMGHAVVCSSTVGGYSSCT